MPGTLLVLIAAVFAADVPEGSNGDVAAISPSQIEADWLRQDEVRGGKTAADGKAVTPEQDARGGVDGVINGEWGFHTEHEAEPWWQVDLGRSQPLDRIVLFNRCHVNMDVRAARIIVRLSDDGETFRQAYRHDGTNFRGHPDKKPLVVRLDGAKARFVRLQLPGTSYFHLDEVQVFPTDAADNIALNKPATQSSTSTWSVNHLPGAVGPRFYAMEQVLRRGRALGADLAQKGVDVSAHVDTLDRAARQWEQLPDDAPEQERQDVYFRARRSVRKMALSNPLLADFDDILLAKRAPGMFPHVSDQYYGWWSRPGGGVYVLKDYKSDDARLVCLTGRFEPGSFLRPELSHDGRRVLFAYSKYYPHVARLPDKVNKDNLPDDSWYKIYEMNVDGTGLRQLTFGKYDDFDARYLPDGRIVFLSTRKGVALQAGKQSAAATCGANLPDSYVRCGGGNQRPVPVFTLHRMNGDGTDLHAISAFENFEWTPSVAADGTILYARWDYIDRFNGHFMSLWSTNPDGTNPQLVYGNYTKKPQCTFEARPIPGSRKLVFTATAHHSITGGSICLLDRRMGTELDRPITRITPEVPFPETEANVGMYYANPMPLSERYFLVAWSDRRLPSHTLMWDDDPKNPRNAMGIYLLDAAGNQTLLHRDPEISSMYPIPIRSRPKPPAMPELVEWDGPAEGRLLVQDVYRGLEGLPRGSIKRLRVIGVLPKVQPHMNNPRLGISREDTGKFILGTAPVESDGSAHFRVPSGIPYFFQAIDDRGFAVQTMRSLTYVQPNQTLACIGCHESRDAAPPAGAMPLAMHRDPSRLTPDPPGTWPLRFDELVQPVLDAHCVECHAPGSKEANAAELDLTAGKAYDGLLGFGGGDLQKLVFERDRSTPGDSPAARSRLMATLTEGDGHFGVRLTTQQIARLAVWMDTYAHLQGAFSPEQEQQLRQLRKDVAPLLTRP